MKKFHIRKRHIAVAAIIVVGGLFFARPSTLHSPTIPPTAPIASPSASTSTNSSCHINGLLPDSNCTLGVADPRVTQANIGQTICVSGYTKTVRPPVSVTNSLKITQIQQYGYTDTNPKSYEEDHLISLELGGSPADPKNLWPELGASPNPKDKTENRLHQEVCAGKITLQQAQFEISHNWTTAQ